MSKKHEEEKFTDEEELNELNTSAGSDAAQSDASTGSATDSADTATDSTEAEKTEENADAGNSEEDTPEKKIEKLEKENADLKDQILRRAADFENYRKRAIQEKQDAFDYGNANLLKDLLDSLDNFDRTVEAAEGATDAKAIADGVKMIAKNLVSMLETKYNLSSYGAKGDEFNPEIHEAIGMMPGEVEKEELGEVYLKGYKLRDKVIRLAKVMVIKPEA